MTNAQLKSAAKRGAKLLDVRKPGWAKKIKITKLSMLHYSDCVIGQLLGEYSDGLKRLGLDYPSDDEDHYGFNTPCPGTKTGCRHVPLGEAWKDEIRKRRARKAVTR